MKTKIVTILALSLFVAMNAQDKKWNLQACIDYALENNIAIQQQELSTELIEEDITIAEGNFYPGVSGSAGQNWNFGSYIGQNGLRISRDTRGNNFGINAGINIFNGFRNVYTLKQAKKSLEAAGFELEVSKNDIMLYVVNSYLNVLLNKESLKIAQDQVAISLNQIKKATGLVESGSKPRATLLEAEATLATNEQQLTAAQNNLDLSLLSLAQLLQIPHRNFDIAPITLNITDASLVYKDTDAIFNRAVDFLPEIKSAEISVENSELAVQIANSRYYPSLSFGAGFGTSYQHTKGQPDERIILDPDTGEITIIPNGFGQQLKDNLGYNLGFSLSIPIFSRFQTKSGVTKAQINQKRTELQLVDAHIKLRETIERAYADAKASLNQFIASEKSLVAQRESFNNAQASYDSGVMTSFDFDQVRNRLVNAQSTLANAKYNFAFRSKLLEYYYGLPIVLN